MMIKLEVGKRGRPKKEPPPYDEEKVKKYVERYFYLEQQIKVLREDKKVLKEEFKDEVDIKLVSAVIQKIKAELKLSASNETIEDISKLIRDKINMVV